MNHVTDRMNHLWQHFIGNGCTEAFGEDDNLNLTEISPWVEGKVQALTRLIWHKLGVLREPSLKRLRWAGPVYRHDGSAVYVRIFDNQITPPCNAWREELKLHNYVISPVVTVEDHHDVVVMAYRSEYRVYECRVCTGTFHIAKTWMWRPIWIQA